MKFDKALIIAEEATDEISHFVGDDSLLAILKSGYIKGTQYDVAKMNFKGDKKFKDYAQNPYELCVVRKGLATDPEKLSENSGKTRILLDKDAILNIRNIRKPYPVAELPVQNGKFLDEAFDKIKERLKNDQYKINKIKELVYSKPMIVPEELKLKLKKIAPELENWLTAELTAQYKIVYDKIRKREGEERFDLSKNTIPLSSKYVKIVLNKNEVSNDEVKKEIRKLYKKDKEIFQKNDVLMGVLNEV